MDVIESAADLLPKIEKIEDKPDIEDLFTDEDEIFNVEEDLKEEDKNLIPDLIDKTDFSQEENIYININNGEEMKSIIKK